VNRKTPEGQSENKRKLRVRFIAKAYAMIIIIVLFAIVLSSAILFIIKFHLTAKSKIDYIAFHEIGNETNQTLLINKILKWEKENVVNLNLKENENYPCVRIPNCLIGWQDNCYIPNPILQNYYLISVTRCGKCGEFAEMFSELANAFGIKSRVIETDNINGGNHAWAEVIINNITIPIDTGNPDGYNSSQFYNCKFLIQYRNIRVQSFWFGEDVSKRYYNWCS
jgi:hypothetical protein